MNKTIAALLFVLCTIIGADAQTGSDPVAKSILDKVAAKFKTYKAVQASFNLKVEDGKGKPQGNKAGTVFISGEKYSITTSNQVIFGDGANVWTYDKSANEVTIAKLDHSSATINIEKLFTNLNGKEFLYKLNGEKKQGAKTVQEIEMTPTDKGKTFHKVYLYIDKTAQTVYAASILEKNGNKYTYTVNSVNGNAALNDSQLVFDKSKYPGVKVVDLRVERQRKPGSTLKN